MTIQIVVCDTPERRQELYAFRHQIWAAELGADSLAYLPLEAVASSINLDPTQLCRGCLTGKYPTPTGEKLYQLSLRQRNTPTSNGRTYELTGSASPA